MNIEGRRIELQISRIRLAREEMELNILEREEEISRIKSAIEKQKEAEVSLKEQLVQIKTGGLGNG